jgi:hypothetical protein
MPTRSAMDAVRRHRVLIILVGLFASGLTALVRAVRHNNTTDIVGVILIFFVIGPIIVFCFDHFAKRRN